jgi:molybdopterin-guanine dinucleotide biosynthesis protein A
MLRFTVAVIAGGASSRMGTDKSFVLLAGKPMIEHVLSRVAELDQAETLIVTNHVDDYAQYHLRTVTDVLPQKGSLGGIYSAIYHSQTEYILTLACDMPFVNPDLLHYMTSLCPGSFDVIVPRVKGYPQGLHAIYSKACLGPIRARLEADRLKVIGFYDQVQVRYLDESEYVRFDPKGLSFHNINTPQELREAEQMLLSNSEA